MASWCLIPMTSCFTTGFFRSGEPSTQEPLRRYGGQDPVLPRILREKKMTTTWMWSPVMFIRKSPEVFQLSAISKDRKEIKEIRVKKETRVIPVIKVYRDRRVIKVTPV